jgi:hypothetical protein
MMKISPVKKSEFLRSIGARRLKGVSLAIVQIIVERINATLGIAFANYSKYAFEAGRERQVAERTIPALCRLGLLKKHARRDGPPVLWAPALMDMTPDEAVRRVEWFVRHQGEDESTYFAGGSVKNDVPSAGSVKNDGSGYIKDDGSGYLKNEVHNTISNKLSLRERALRRSSDGKSPRTKGTRLPEDWRLSQADRDFAKRYGLADAEIETEGELFHAHWTSESGSKAVKLNWSRAWQTWIIREFKYRKQKGKPAANSRPQRDPHTFTNEEWRKNGDFLVRQGAAWPEAYWGPPPGHPDCLMPEPLQLELGLNGDAAKAGAA